MINLFIYKMNSDKQEQKMQEQNKMHLQNQFVSKSRKKLIELLPLKVKDDILNTVLYSEENIQFSYFKRRKKNIEITEIKGLNININTEEYPISDFNKIRQNCQQANFLKFQKNLEDQSVLMYILINEEKIILKRQFISSKLN